MTLLVLNGNAIARSVRNIVMTIPGEKPFNENFGSKVSGLLFENVDDITAAVIADEIEESIKNYEPRVSLRNVEVFPDFDNNSFDAVVTYDIIGADAPPQELQFALLPTR